MTDSKLRDLERRFHATGVLADEAALLRGRVQAGELTLARLSAAAELGHAGAKAALGARATRQAEPPQAAVTFETFACADHVTLYVTGHYGLGSLGNVDAAAIQTALGEALLMAGRRKVTLDMSCMSYRWGDALCRLLLLEPKVDLDYVFNRECSEAWNGILSLASPHWLEGLETRYRFRSPTQAPE